ncbi:hypothetical protein VP01_6367g1 [Puccinia sorghi]|uniref:Uncharacterized protein n=1 Tax=Puccinia sorghi TaxID=27349 RepID=A0A0L6UGW2_9BASI|nr:hypothetical protein VP01_6367g1 [Puccinia sorghi]
MVKCIKTEVPNFNHRKHFFGHVAHITNLAAKLSLSTFGTIEEDIEDHKLQKSMMEFFFITHEPGGVNVNLKAGLKFIHRLSVFV